MPVVASNVSTSSKGRGSKRAGEGTAAFSSPSASFVPGGEPLIERASRAIARTARGHRCNARSPICTSNWRCVDRRWESMVRDVGCKIYRGSRTEERILSSRSDLIVIGRGKAHPFTRTRPAGFRRVHGHFHLAGALNRRRALSPVPLGSTHVEDETERLRVGRIVHPRELERFDEDVRLPRLLRRSRWCVRCLMLTTRREGG